VLVEIEAHAELKEKYGSRYPCGEGEHFLIKTDRLKGVYWIENVIVVVEPRGPEVTDLKEFNFIIVIKKA